MFTRLALPGPAVGRRAVTPLSGSVSEIGGVPDAPDLTPAEPLVLLTRDRAGGFTARLDNTVQQTGR